MMAIEKSGFKVVTRRFDPEFSPNSRETMSSDDEEVQRRISAAGSDDDDDDDEFDDADSGAGSDDFDLLDLGDTGAEFCKVGNATCSVPYELYDLPGLEDILSVDVWNEVLSEEDRMNLTGYLPDMDELTFMRTLKELFEAENFHFGSPVKKLFDLLKGGQFEPRVALYREGMNFLAKRSHYHFVRQYHNGMVSNLCQTRDAWLNCKGYSIEEKLRVLNIQKSQRSLMNEKMEEDLASDSSQKQESGDGFWSKRFKNKKNAPKLAHRSPYGPGVGLEFSPRMPFAGMEVPKHGKQNPKGILKVSRSNTPLSKEMLVQFPPAYDGYGSAMPVPRRDKAALCDPGAVLRLKDRIRYVDEDNNDAEDAVCRMAFLRNRSAAHSSLADRSGVSKAGKKHKHLRTKEFAPDSFVALPLPLKNEFHGYGRSKNASLLSDAIGFTPKPPSIRSSYDSAEKAKYPEDIQNFTVGDPMKYRKGKIPQQLLKANRAGLFDHAESHWLSKNHVPSVPVDSSFKADDWNMKSKKWKTQRGSPDLNFKSYRASSPLVDDRILISELRTKPSQEKIRGDFLPNGAPRRGVSKASRIYKKSDETESDSSEQLDDDDDDDEEYNPLIRAKSASRSDGIESSRLNSLKPGVDAKRAVFAKKDMQNGTTRMSKISELEHAPRYLSKSKYKAKMHVGSPLHSSNSRILEDSYPFDLVQTGDEDDGKGVYKLSRDVQLPGQTGVGVSSLKAYPSDRKHKRNFNHDYVDQDESGPLADDNLLVKSRRKGQSTEAYDPDLLQNYEPSPVFCNSGAKRRKTKEDLVAIDERNVDGNMQSLIDDTNSLKKKGKRKLDAETGTSDVETSELPVKEMEPVEMEVETKPQKKPYTPITPTVHTGFSFSIIHLLSAVRMAMITLLPEDSMEIEEPRQEQNGEHEGDTNGVVLSENVNVTNSDHPAAAKVPSLTLQEIVNRVRSNPLDPSILETQEPLQDLVRGVLKIFSSKTAPLGAKNWKALVIYERSTKSWSWVGPVFRPSADHEAVEEVTSPDYWGIPYKMLVKLVDSFANWLKNGQETLQQIGSLPAPPQSLTEYNLDEKERFRDLRAQKSLSTISSSSEEVRVYFRKEEVLRYSIPDRAFSYTAVDGKKSIVAPLRRCGGKPTSKARDHFMLKRDRPPHVTILCLVRDAAARLPGSIGTRADVCTLIRDSQYIVEEVSDAQVNQVVSGALDRLHYERDPCVQFDGERKLWVYLHREREEEDFEDDGTSSTKKWKRQKKDPTDQDQDQDQGAVTQPFHETGDQSGFDLGSDLNVEPLGTDDDRRTGHNDARPSAEDNVDTSHGSEQDNMMHQDHSTALDADVSINPMQENKMICQENFTSEDFDDETFGIEGPDDILGANLF